MIILVACACACVHADITLKFEDIYTWSYLFVFNAEDIWVVHWTNFFFCYEIAKEEIVKIFNSMHIEKHPSNTKEKPSN